KRFILWGRAWAFWLVAFFGPRPPGTSFFHNVHSGLIFLNAACELGAALLLETFAFSAHRCRRRWRYGCFSRCVHSQFRVFRLCQCFRFSQRIGPITDSDFFSEFLSITTSDSLCFPSLS